MPPAPAPTADGDGPALDIRRIIESRDRHGVEYLLVGGMAARFYGAARTTKDVDLVPNSHAENLDRLAMTLRDLGAFLRVGGLSDEDAQALPVVRSRPADRLENQQPSHYSYSNS